MDAVGPLGNSYHYIPLSKELPLDRFNGVDIIQIRDYIKLSNETYLNKVLQHHEWLSTINEQQISILVTLKAINFSSKQMKELSDLFCFD
mmetsp:Transcript_26200/g.32295  ORF Transcript_26200/g.32295 Transcript_26200/m.32295 type:complete len:90 (-) Transcript_26200:223-492(-)